MLRGFFLGIVATLVVGLLYVYVGVVQGFLIPANADARPSRLERWAASRSLHAALEREMPRQANPIPATDANYAAGIKLYAENCAMCHGTADGHPSNVAIGLYQHAPQLGRHGVEDDPDGETYWKIKHGIRLTGMPSYTKTLSEDQIWTLALFLKHMDELPSAPNRLWHAVKNPAALAPAAALPGGEGVVRKVKNERKS
jgi:thiosulfate dehydrogenase